MTVSSLWKALDKGGSGKAVGVQQLVDPSASSNAAQNPRPHQLPTKPQTLAVDLSIWICESLTSYGMSEQNANPALHLVFTRTMKLLNLGINLVVVIEGKQRIRDFSGDTADKFRKRRSGTAFWKACKDCENMLGLLGVPVVRAKSEGEALCALLSQRGIVDGVISNDGDCLVFGAKVIYTKYSNENLDNGRVIRYELGSLYAEVEASDDEDIGDSETGTIVKLSRSDLISFALLTGSDLVGAGLPKVGHKKAIRFIRKCQQDNPLTKETASLDELRSWAIAATADMPLHHDSGADKEKGSNKCCSRCNHTGSKRSHEKHGCAICGTEPGEPCYLVTAEDRFRKSLRAKALAMRPKFDPSQVYEAYMRPNANQLPVQFVGLHAVHMSPPRLVSLLGMPLIVKGRSFEGSRAFVRNQVSQLLSRRELHRGNHSLAEETANGVDRHITRERPVAKEINKALTQNQVPCYEVTWIVNATATDENGEGVDGYEYTTVEARDLVEQKYPKLVEAFQAVQIERAKQGDGMKNQRRDFLENILFRSGVQQQQQQQQQGDKKRKPDKKRAAFFQNHKSLPMRDYQATARKRRRRQKKKSRKQGGDDVGNLLRFASRALQISPAKTKAVLESDSVGTLEEPKTPSAESGEEDLLFCRLGAYEVQITPVESNHGAYPPKQIFVHNW